MMEKNGFPYSRFHLNQIRGVAAEKHVVFSIILSAAIDMLDRDHGQMGQRSHNCMCIQPYSFQQTQWKSWPNDSGLDCQNYNL